MNFHKNPDVEDFNEEHVIRPRGMQLLQQTLQLLSGQRDLFLMHATRFENSSMLREYSKTKLALSRRPGGISQPGSALAAVMSKEQYSVIKAAGAKMSFGMENIDFDINEVYLWAPVTTKESDHMPDIRSAADRAAYANRLFGSPSDALHYSTPIAGGLKAVFFCRVLCGEIGSDSKIGTLVNTGASGHGDVRYFRMQGEGLQIYPEMLAQVKVDNPSIELPADTDLSSFAAPDSLSAMYSFQPPERPKTSL
mmetsp:Transcript_120209/g.195620  ORF Transcript_120209/g.195620 Transcript_120209/m.195620 type:complete len:252 (+) Transcript_120209:3-758(+)